MIEFILGGFALFTAFAAGKFYGSKLVRESAANAAQTFIDACRERFGETVAREIEVEDGETEVYEFLELPEDLEELGDELFNL